MKSIIFIISCFALIFTVTCVDLHVGKREDGDVLVASRRLVRNAIPGNPGLAWSGYNAAGTITALNAVNAPGSEAKIVIVKGGPGTNTVVVVAFGKIGRGIDVQLDIYATLDKQTTPAQNVS